MLPGDHAAPVCLAFRAAIGFWFRHHLDNGPKERQLRAACTHAAQWQEEL